VQFQADWDWAAAQSSFSRALEIDVRNADAMRGLARVLTSRGRVDEAIALRRRMVEQDPVSQSVRAGLALTYLYARRFDEAVQALEPYVASWSRPRTDALLAVAHAAGGHCGQALAALAPERGPRGLEPDAQTVGAVRGWVYATCGRVDEARRVAASLESGAARGAVDVALLAILHGALGNHDRAFDYLGRGVAERSPTVIMIDVDPMFDSLRDDPRFEPLAALVRAGGTEAGRRP
jgi:tetratricopeptide (TPR) repeat protein